MADAFVIEHRDLTAGIAVRERGGFRFYCSDALFRALDAHKFRGLRELRKAIRHVVERQPAALDLRRMAG